MSELFIHDWLKIDRKAAEKIQREQVELRRKHHFDAQTIRREGNAKENQKHYEREIMLAQQVLSSLQESDTKAIKFQKRRLADNYLRLGQLDNAELYAVSDTQRKEIAAMRHAIERDDKDQCHCSDDFPNGVHVTRHNTVGMVHSHKHGQLMPVVKCSKCGEINVTAVEPKKPDVSKLFPRGRPVLHQVVRKQ